MKRAIPVNEFLATKKDVIEFDGRYLGAFDKPEVKGVWFIWGNSGSGKTRLGLLLAKYLTKWFKVAYNSLEEGDSLTMQQAFRDVGMAEVGNKIVLIQESIEELDKRLKARRSPDCVVIDSFQYTQLTYKKYIEFKERHRKKLIIFTSQADGKQPSGRAAKSVMYDASLKIWVEGYRAISKGRFIGKDPYFTIWHEGAQRYWD